MNPFLSVCIPAYNRPKELLRLLNSVDASDIQAIEIIIKEDKSPKRSEIKQVVEEFKRTSKYMVRYYENDENYGYDKNLRTLAQIANGKWVIYMGDDDIFVKNSLDKYIAFLKGHSQLGYVLRRYRASYNDGKVEEYRYDDKHVFFEKGIDSYVELFRRSLFISGFTFRKACFDDYDFAGFDGTLLFQLYIQASICLNTPSAYCDIPITQSIEGGTPYFGNSENEKHLYESGSITFNNSINFMKQVNVVTSGIDKKYGINSSDKIMKSYSKYSYGYLHEHRDKGVKVFCQYAKELKKLGFANSFYFYVYFWGLLILGKRNCQKIIQFIKKVKGKTPKL